MTDTTRRDAVLDSGMVATVPDRCVPTIRRGLPLTSVPLPFPLPPNEVRQWWHPRPDLDPGHPWLRGLFDASVLPPVC